MPHSSDRTLVQFLITMAFVIMVAIFNWIKKRSQPGESTDAGPERRLPPPPRPTYQTSRAVPPSAAPRPTIRKINWEEELRRMLEGNQPAPPPPQRSAEQEPVPPPVTAPPLIYTARPAQSRPVEVEQDRGLPVQLAGLTVSAQSYERASQLDENVADHLREIGAQVQRHAAPRRPGMVSQEIAHALALVRTPHSLRTVIMASVILGPPKAFETG